MFTTTPPVDPLANLASLDAIDRQVMGKRQEGYGLGTGYVFVATGPDGQCRRFNHVPYTILPNEYLPWSIPRISGLIGWRVYWLELEWLYPVSRHEPWHTTPRRTREQDDRQAPPTGHAVRQEPAAPPAYSDQPAHGVDGLAG